MPTPDASAVAIMVTVSSATKRTPQASASAARPSSTPRRSPKRRVSPPAANAPAPMASTGSDVSNAATG
ncbi:hypothetical protein A6P55_07430 [Pandoraea pnomenusa]|nr:hypothetical protein [Pandoraea pnomenusa]ANC44074.1 hypothetical protein A6P55_07430 [Pandoraea pnomenusa]